MTGEFKITNRIDGWEVLVACNEHMACGIQGNYFPPLGKGKGRKDRLRSLRRAWNTLWDCEAKWNDGLKTGDAMRFIPTFRVL